MTDKVDEQLLEKVKKDPNGLIKRDMAMLERAFGNRTITPQTSHAEIMFHAGQQRVLDWIQENLIRDK